MRRSRPWLVALYVLLLTAACDQSMSDQPKLKPLGTAPAFKHGAAARPLPEGVVSRNGQTPREARTPPPVNELLLARGQERFNIYCSPCHGRDGYADGIVVQRGFPNPPSFHSDRLRHVSAQYIYDVITDGYGVMYSYADRVPPDDRWAIIAYIRALQLSQKVSVQQVPGAREKLP